MQDRLDGDAGCQNGSVGYKIKALASKPENVNSIPSAQMADGETSRH